MGKSTYLEIEGQHKDYSVVAFICNDPQTWSQENGSVGLCAIHEVWFYTDHDDAWGCGLHSNCFGVFRMMHFADGAFLMRTHSGCPKKGYFLNYWTWHWLWVPAWIPSVELLTIFCGTPRIPSIALGIYILEQRIPLLRWCPGQYMKPKQIFCFHA